MQHALESRRPSPTPDSASMLHRFPYLPPHVTKPKEVKRIYVVALPDKCFFAVSQGCMSAFHSGTHDVLSRFAYQQLPVRKH